jgi:hypothetical protein
MSLFTDKVKQYNSRLMSDLGISREQACGIWGNLGTETGGFTALQEKRPTVAGSRGGYGWMQWTGPRRRKYEAWCKDNRLNQAEDETNYRYLVQETKTDEAHSLSQLKKTTTIEAATETFMRQNLRPGKPNLENRINFAKQAYNAQVSSSKVTTQVGTSAVVVGAGTAAATQVGPQHLAWAHDHWMLLGVIAGIIYLIHKHHEQDKQDLVVLPAAKKTVKQKGIKRNGK